MSFQVDIPTEEKAMYLDSICDELCPATPAGEGAARKTKAFSPEYEKVLDPNRDAAYPLSRAGTLLRVTKEFLPNFVNFPKLVSLLRNSESEIVRRMFGDGRLSDQARLHLVMEASYRLGTGSYSPEWGEEAAIEGLKFYDKRKHAVKIANQLVGREIIHDMFDLFNKTKDPAIILDAGTGQGGTSMPLITYLNDWDIIKVIPKDWNERTRVIGLDVCEHALNITKNKLMRHLPDANLTSIAANFGQISSNEELKKYFGQVDFIISGGSIMHNTDKDPFFQTMYNLLKPGGRILIWDWADYSWSAPTIRVSKDDQRRTIYLDEKGEKAHELAEGETADFETLMLVSGMDAISEIREKDVLAIRQNLINIWLGAVWDEDSGNLIPSAFGYDHQGYPGQSSRYEAEFYDSILSRKGFNFLEFAGRVVTKEPVPPKEKRTPYFFIEGYGPAKFYIGYMKRAGFSNARYSPFSEVFDRHKDRFKESKKEIKAYHSLFFATATK